MKRNQFLKISCAALGFGGIAGLATGCSAYQVIKTNPVNGMIRVPLSEFDVEHTKLIRVAQMQYDILVRKSGADQYSAILLKCSHQDWAVTAGKSTINCTYHGSAFGLDGKVISGPADAPLQTLVTRVENGFLLVTSS